MPRDAISGLQSESKTVNGIRMHARVGLGHAPPGRTPVVLVHGLGISSTYMAPLARHLAPHAPTYALDLPGFGLSDAPKGVPDMPALAAWVKAWMDAEGLPRASFVANSMGCQVVAELAARWPARAERLVLIGPVIGGAGDAPRAALRLLVDATREPLSLLPLHVRDDFRAGLGRVARTGFHSIRHALRNVLPRVEAPMLVVRGTRDPLVTRRDAREAILLARRARLVEVPGAAHAINYSAPDVLAEAILPFLFRQNTQPSELPASREPWRWA